MAADEVRVELCAQARTQRRGIQVSTATKPSGWGQSDRAFLASRRRFPMYGHPGQSAQRTTARHRDVPYWPPGPGLGSR
jgi:hypothetical protein